MSISDSTDPLPLASKWRSSLAGRNSANERTTREIVGDQAELPPLADGEIVAGRYVVLRALGRGGFSDVYLVQDLELDRQVAMKRLLLSGLDSQHMKAEAKILASLDHPSIVRIFDICEDGELGVFMLMQYVPGPSLRELMQQRLPIHRAVDIAIRICGGLIHAHSRGVVHRDIKPTNIIMSNYGEPLITDFGLALTPASKYESGFQGGTPRYMSPEQIRQETNRMSPSSDIFSTGIVLYEMLSGQVPFNGSSPEAVSDATLCHTPKLLTALNPSVPAELDRICRHALRKNVKDRYGSMEAFQADLIQWLRSQEALAEVPLTKESESQTFYASGFSSSSKSVSHLSQVTLRGLQPFLEEDASFYLSLIPGAIAPNGLPDSLQFWKQWTEDFNNNLYSRVGILYGPCGSGKTSFVRAGLTPHLAPDILPLYIECRAGDLYSQLEDAISEYSEFPLGHNLTSLLIQLRDNPELRKEHRKVVLLLDQFDAWASPATTDELQALAAALRHCDGEALQTLIVIRDDYWVPTTEFLHLVECGVEQWKNARAVELIDRHHARRLLESVGRSYGSLPALPEPLDQQQTEFLDRAIEQMVLKGRIVPIQLAMFIKMAKLLPWHPDTLTNAGETQGMCVNLFQDLFEGQAAPPIYQRVKGSVADVLQMLLPAPDQTVRCVVVSSEDLQEVVALAGRENQLYRALQILIEDLRLVIRVALPPAGQLTNSQLTNSQYSANDDRPTDMRKIEYYQLANDFLTEPVRMWVNQVRKSDWRGRVKGRLEELSAIWSRRQEQRYLPTLIELLEMQLAVPRKRLNGTQRAYLNAATRVQAFFCSMALGIAATVGLVGWFSIHQYRHSHRVHRADVSSQVDTALHGNANLFHVLLDKLANEQKLVREYAQPWLFSSDPIVRTRAKLLYTCATKKSFEQLTLDFPVLEPALGPAVLELAQACPDAQDLVRELFNSTPETTVSKARAAITLAYLGDDEPLCKLLDFGSGGDTNNLCFNQALTWKSSANLWTRLLEKNPTPGVAYHALGILASYPDSELPNDFPWSHVDVLCNHADPCLRNTAKWFLEQAGRSRTLADQPSPNVRRIPTGIEFVRVQPGMLQLKLPIIIAGGPKLFSKIEFQRPFWISKAAVTNRQFESFLSELAKSPNASRYRQYTPASARTPDYEKNPERPVTGYDIEYLCAYCNWLSEKAGLAPAYQEVNREATADIVRFEQVPHSPGIRLPNVQELTFAFAASASEPSLLQTPLVIKAKCESNSGVEPFSDYFARTDLARDLIPNRFGIHFMEYSYVNLVQHDGHLYNFQILEKGDFRQYFMNKTPLVTDYSLTHLVQEFPAEPDLAESQNEELAGRSGS